MKNLVFESLDELLESKKLVDVKATHEKIEKSSAEKQRETKKLKVERAVETLKNEIIKAKKPGAFKTTLQKNAKIKELEEKIKVWKRKLH